MELEYQNYPKFTPEMKKTHTILIPNMAPVQFRILAAVMRAGRLHVRAAGKLRQPGGASWG